MKNRTRLIEHTDLYDLLTRIQNNSKNPTCGCIVYQIIGKNTNRCKSYFNKNFIQDCEQCIADWLNEEEV